jgi:hypothetical protein
MKCTFACGALCLWILFSSCEGGLQRYDDGPAVSFYTAKNRITNTWSWSLAIENGLNRTGLRADSSLILTEEEIVRICPVDSSESCREGRWNFTTKKRKLQLIFGQQADAFDILRLTKNEMWLSLNDSVNNRQIRWELKPR